MPTRTPPQSCMAEIRTVDSLRSALSSFLVAAGVWSDVIMISSMQRVLLIYNTTVLRHMIVCFHSFSFETELKLDIPGK